MPGQEHILRIAFLAGAVTDAMAIFPLLVPAIARRLWGFDDLPGSYMFAAGYAASLMLGWTALLLWAYQRPLDRKFVAPLTIVVIYGLALTEVVAVFTGHLSLQRIAPTWCLQAVLAGLFASGYHHRTLHHLIGASSSV